MSIGWSGCVVKVKRQTTATKGQDQGMIQGPWGQTTCTPGSSGPVFIYSKRRERAHETGSLAGVSAPWPGIQSTASAAVWRHIPHSALQCKDPHPSLPGTDIAVGGGQVPCGTRLSGTKKYTSSPAQGTRGPSEESVQHRL